MRNQGYPVLRGRSHDLITLLRTYEQGDEIVRTVNRGHGDILGENMTTRARIEEDDIDMVAF